MSETHTIPLHIGDLIQDTYHLSTVEFGAYMRLLLAHYRAGEEGLPGDENHLRKLTGMDNKTWSKSRDILLGYFNRVETESGFLFQQKRVTETLRHIKSVREQNRDKALRKHNSGSAAAHKWQSHGSADALQSRSHKPKTNKKKGGDDAAYAFKGLVIRLTQSDYDCWKKQFHAIPDLDSELRQLDLWHHENGTPSGEWFRRVSAALNREHQRRLVESTPAKRAARKDAWD